MSRFLLGRRAVLRGGAGVTFGLPLLESLAGKKALAATPRRLAILFECNGVNMSRFWPKSQGPLTAESMLGTALEPLVPHASRVLVPRGLDMFPGRGLSPSGDDHMKGMACKLTCAPTTRGGGQFPAAPSLDQVVARSINPNGKGPLNLAVGPSRGDLLGSAFFTFSGQPAPMQRNPWNAFKDWMGTGRAPDPAAAGAAIDHNASRRKKVLDLVREDLMSLQQGRALGAADRRKLDLHLTTVERLESAMSTGGFGATGCSFSPARTKEIEATPAGDLEKATEAMIDIMALSMACDHNRVTTLQIGRGAADPVYRWVPGGAGRGHHPLSHDGGATAQQILFEIDKWHMKMFARLVGHLAGYAEGPGSVLDNAVVLYANELSNGRTHRNTDLPYVLAGSGGGVLKQGAYLNLGGGVPNNKLYVTVANALGYREANGGPMTVFGKGNPPEGELAALRA